MTVRYRAWDNANKEMFKDTFSITESGQVVVVEQEDVMCPPDYVFVDHLVIMQSTGLFDKNDKEIFEGDVVKCNGLLGTIESFKAMWICSFVKYNNYQKVGFFAQEIEVVGNIYENPELLEDEE